jgi:hypothetical protein
LGDPFPQRSYRFSVLPRLGLQVDENSVIGLMEYVALQQMQLVYL